jgi:transposase
VAHPQAHELESQKKSIRASERQEAARAEFVQATRQVTARRFVFVDESGSHTSMTPLYGWAPSWAPKSERAVESVPKNRGRNTTIIGALSWLGVQAAMTLEGAARAPSGWTLAFEAFVEQVLCPTLEPEQIVVMDNLSIHKSARVRELIERCGCQLWFLPTYSPDFNPIEQAWSKLKAFLKQRQARSAPALQEAIALGLPLITPQNAQAWFKHCGYQILGQLN